MKRPLLSLKGQALALLARREHSRAELRQKLLAHAAKQAQTQAQAAAAAVSLRHGGPASGSASSFPAPSHDFETAFLRPEGPAGSPEAGAGGQAHAPGEIPEPVDPGPEVDAVLDWLESQKYLSDQRFVESRVATRSGRYGQARIRQELSRHGLELDADTSRELRSTELARAREVWLRKFGEVAPDAAGRARQARFLAARGFAADVVWRLVGGRDDE